MKNTKIEYIAQVGFWDGPHWIEAGTPVFKTREAAKYQVPHILKEAKPASPKAKVPDSATASSVAPKPKTK